MSDQFTGLTHGDFESDIRNGLWIPVTFDSSMLVGSFRFSNLSGLECNLLRRLFWEECLLHLGGEFAKVASLSSCYAKSSYLKYCQEIQ